MAKPDPERDARILDLIRRGISYTETAKMLGLSRGVVSGAVYRSKNPPAYVAQADRPRQRYEVDPFGYIARLAPAKYPYAADISCPDFAHDDEHCEAVNDCGGFPVLRIAHR